FRNCPVIEAQRAFDLKLDQMSETVGLTRTGDIGDAHAVFRQFVERQVNPVAPRVLADIADDIRELESHAQIGRVFERALILVAEYFRRQQADDARYALTVDAKRRELRHT